MGWSSRWRAFAVHGRAGRVDRHRGPAVHRPRPRFTASGLQWVVNAYVLTFAGFLLFGGRAADLFGRRRSYLFGLGLFTVASLASGVAQTSAWLTAARAAQGVGGAFRPPPV